MSDRRHANDLDGRTWTRHSISVWSDLRKTREEAALKHPAMFPQSLAARLLECFTSKDDGCILDPFCGSGSTILAALDAGKNAIGIDLSGEYVDLTAERAAGLLALPEDKPLPEERCRLHLADARSVADLVPPESVDFVLTSPPYWDILLSRRTADRKAIRHYGEEREDLGRISDYEAFLDGLQEVFSGVLTTLRPGAYCCVIVMDLRKKSQFYPLHSDLAARLQQVGYLYDDLIIWDRRHEYNLFRPLGYPWVFRVNKAHEFILIFQKPRA